jgi:hypothetical protein
MTPKDKAKELVDKFYNYTMDVFIISKSLECSKQCALIAVDEVLENSHTNTFTIYWKEVKQEIEKL